MRTQDLRSWLRQEGEARVLIPTLTAGLVIGIVEVVLAASFAALIFSGRLAPYLPQAIGLILWSAIVVMVVVGLGTSLSGLVASIQDVSAAILAVMAAAIAQLVRGSGDEAFLSTVLAIILTSLLTGGFFFLLGTFRLGNLVRFIPHPVIGGFLAGTGWLLFKGGLGLLTGTALSLATVSQFFRPELLGRWVPGLAFAVVVLASVRRYGHFLIIPGAVLGAAVLFFLVLLPFGSLHEAEAGGWLLGPLPAGGLWRPWLPSAISGADWGAVLGQLGSVATVVLLSVVALLLNATGIELLAGRDVDLNRELRVAGLANVASGFGGGPVGFQALTLTALAQRTGTSSRLVGVVAAAVCGVALLFGASLLGLFPRVVLGGLIVSLGIAFLTEWLLDGWRKLPRSDYAVVLVIVLVIATLGFLQGVGVGILLAVVLFVIEYSRTEVVRSELSVATFRSNVDRPPAHEEAIRSAGERVSILLLQGHLFFGTANRLLERVRARIVDPGPPRLEFLVLDFGRVSALDSSAVLSFGKAQKLAEAHGFELVFAGLSERLKLQMLRGGVHLRGTPDLRGPRPRGPVVRGPAPGGGTAPARSPRPLDRPPRHRWRAREPRAPHAVPGAHRDRPRPERDTAGRSLRRRVLPGVGCAYSTDGSGRRGSPPATHDGPGHGGGGGRVLRRDAA